MDRGHRLEEEAIEIFEKKTGKKVERVGFCLHDQYDCIASSPDGLIKSKGKYTEAVEIKCLNSAMHLKALLENEIPSEYELQALQYFIVNDDLKKLHFVFYDPRIACRPYHAIELNREDIKEDIEKYREYQIDTINEVNEIVEQLAF